jgi:hypothetical protein
MTVRGVSSAALLAVSLVAAPVAASAAPVAGARAGAPLAEGDHLAGGNALAWAMAALILGITGYLIISDDDEDDAPVSP